MSTTTQQQQTDALRALAEYMRQHPELLALIPKGKSDEFDALCSKLDESLHLPNKCGDANLLMRRVTRDSMTCPPLLYFPARIVEHRHHMRCILSQGTSDQKYLNMPLASKEEWFTRDCVGIHSIRLIGSDSIGLWGSVEICHKDRHTVEFGLIRDAILYELLQVFASGDNGYRSRDKLPLTSSFNPRGCWLPVPAWDPEHYSIQLCLHDADIDEVKVEFTCMLARDREWHTYHPATFMRPHVSRNEIREKILPGCTSFSFGLLNIEGCVGMGIAPDFTAGGFVWHIKEAQLLDESGKCIIVWDRDTMHHDIKCKMGIILFQSH